MIYQLLSKELVSIIKNNMFSDSISDAYQTIYESILEYNDYCESARALTIEAMTNLNMIKQQFFTHEEHALPLAVQRARALDIATYDYDKAIRGVEYLDGCWSNHHLYQKN
jgi:hypothetical protein